VVGGGERRTRGADWTRRVGTREWGSAGRIADEAISHLAGIVGAAVHVTLEIQADIPSGVPEKVVRIVTENTRTLRFETQGFQDE